MTKLHNNNFNVSFTFSYTTLYLFLAWTTLFKGCLSILSKSPSYYWFELVETRSFSFRTSKYIYDIYNAGLIESDRSKVLLWIHARLFVDALWSPNGKGLTSWLSFVMSNCDGATFPFVSWVRGCAWLYLFLIFALFLTFIWIRFSKNIIFKYLYLLKPSFSPVYLA